MSAGRHKIPTTWVTCAACGKRGYPSKRAAKALKRHHADRDLSIYRCGDYWHVGHLAPRVKAGKESRTSLYSHRRRSSRKAVRS